LAGQCFSQFLSRLILQSSPLIELESFKTSPAFAGLLFKSRTGSWAGCWSFKLKRLVFSFVLQFKYLLYFSNFE
jgi:hypothetical protein